MKCVCKLHFNQLLLLEDAGRTMVVPLPAPPCSSLSLPCSSLLSLPLSAPPCPLLLLPAPPCSSMPLSCPSLLLHAPSLLSLPLPAPPAPPCPLLLLPAPSCFSLPLPAFPSRQIGVSNPTCVTYLFLLYNLQCNIQIFGMQWMGVGWVSV